MKYILIASDDKDLSAVDGAPFDERYHISDITDEEITSIFSKDTNRILILGSDVFDRVSKLVHFPIRRAKFNSLFSVDVLTLGNGCKVKCQGEWNKQWCSSIFKESQLTAICPDEPEVTAIYSDYEGEAVTALREMIDLPKGTLFGFDYETSGLPNKSIESENFRFKQLQGNPTKLTSYSGKTFQVTGVSICSEDRKSIYFNVKNIVDGPNAKEFWNDMMEFLDKHSETNWVYNAHFETWVSYMMFHKFYIFQDAAAVNYIEGRNMTRQNLKVTTQRILKIRSWDDAFDELVDQINGLLSDSYQVDWNEGTVVQDGLKCIWYESPRYSEIFRPFGDDMVAEAIKLAKSSFMNPFLCIPDKILGKYCNIDSYSTLELARYMRGKYSKDCIEIFTANLRFHVYLGATGNYIDVKEYNRQKSVANKASNWGMLVTWQQLTKIELNLYKDIPSVDEELTKNQIVNWSINNVTKYSTNKTQQLSTIIHQCLNWNSDFQCDINKLHEAFPYDYTYDAIWKSIMDWGGLGNALANGRNAKKFFNANAWIINEYGILGQEDCDKVNDYISYLELVRRKEWLIYLCNKIPYWDSDVPEYIGFDTSRSSLVGGFIDSNGKRWFESDEFDQFVKLMNIPTKTEDPHYFISGCLNCGSPNGMGHIKEMMLRHTDGFLSMLLLSWLKYDSYVYGPELENALKNIDAPDYDVWNKVKDIKINVQRLILSEDGEIINCMPIFTDFYTELYEDIDTPVGKIHKAFNCNNLPEEDRRISTHPEYMNIPMMELEDEGHIGERYMYVDHFISREQLISMFNTWWKRDIRGYKDFVGVICTSFGEFESQTLKNPWDWNKLCQTKLDATGTILDELRAVLGLYTWRKFRKIIGTYLKNLLIEGMNYTKDEYTEENGLVISEYVEPEWKEGWDVARGHPNWNCMGVHTKRWCLTGDTPILMLDGRTLPIKDMQSEVGNEVLSYDTENKKYVPGKIIAWDITGRDQNVYKVTFDTGLEVKATDNHQFLKSDGTYVALRDMKVGDKFIRLGINGVTEVTSIDYYGVEDVYDIEVDKYHNFTIGSDIKSVVVHNSSGFHTLFGQSDTKKIITVPKDKLFFYLDISQAEPRTLAYKSGDPLMKGWYEAGRDVYIELAKLFNPEIVNSTELTEDQKKARLKELRGLYKVLVLAIMYGMGIGALAGMTGKPVNVAKKYKKDFLDAMPKLEEFIKTRMEYPSWDDPSVMTILGDYLGLYEWDSYRWPRQGINFCIQSFSAMALVAGFENMVRTAMHDGLTFSPIGTVHDSSQMIMDSKFIYNCQAHFDLNYTEYIYRSQGVKYKGDIKIGVNYYDLSKLHVVNENTIELTGSADSINGILSHLRNAGVTDMKLDCDESSIIPDYYSSVPKQVARTFGGGAMPDKSTYVVNITFGDDVTQYHRSLVEGELTMNEVELPQDDLVIDSSEFNDVDNEVETDE
jgi:hypothetical protein